MQPTFFKGVVLGAATSIVVMAGTAALAGTGVGDVFNLGVPNTVDQSTVLQGAAANNPQLVVTTAGSAAAIRGDSTGGRGLFGRHRNATGTDPGVEGETSSTSAMAAGVIGRVPATAGLSAAGLRGINPSIQADRYGVWGSVAGSGVGVYGQATGGSGVLGEATSGGGVLGTATTGIAVRGLSQSGRGVQGQNLSSTRSINGDQPGVFGNAGGDDGGQFFSNTGFGAIGRSSSSIGLVGVGAGGTAPIPDPSLQYGVFGSGTGAGLVGQNTGTGPALRLTTIAGPPMALNSSVKVDNLNADFLDGKDASSFLQTGSCAVGLIHGYARIAGSSGFSSTYTTSGVSIPFNCTGGQVLARRVSTGVYYVRFAGNGSQLIVGNVINDDNDFVSWNYQADPLDGTNSFRVAVVNTGATHEDRTFSVMLM
jgi:hypothetical protein